LVPTEGCRPHESDEGIVYEAKIRKEDIYAYLVLNDTVFLNPDKLFKPFRGESSPAQGRRKEVVRGEFGHFSFEESP